MSDVAAPPKPAEDGGKDGSGGYDGWNNVDATATVVCIALIIVL